MRDRRDFLKVSAVLGGALGADLLSMNLVESSAIATAPKPLRILILGGTEDTHAGFTQPNIAKALSKGLTFRPFADTVRETIAFYKAQTLERQEALRAGLAPDRENEVLAAWHGKRGRP